MRSPAISVVVPVFNRRDLLPRCLASIAAQTFRDFELIVVDDGSSDAPPESLVTGFVPEARIVRHDANRGAAAARNTGIGASRGEWIAFLDSDDAWTAEKLALQASCVLQSAGRIVASCTGYFLYRRGYVLEICPKMRPGDFATQILWGCNISPGSTLLIHRQVFDQVGPFDETLRRLEDWDWLLRFSQHFDMGFLQQPLAHVYVESGSLRDNFNAARDPVMQAVSHIRDKHLPVIRARGLIAAAKFRSSLNTECAARMHNAGRPFAAALYVARALFRYPMRNAEFFRTLWRSIWRP